MIFKTIKTEKIPIKLWLEDIEEGALKQAINLANLPFAFRSIAIMPDAHKGFGMPIGGVLATVDTIIPNAVGVDIGCGVCAQRTSLKKIEKDLLKKIMGSIRKRIPLGFLHHKQRQEWKGFDEAPDVKIVRQENSAAQYQLGTLGGGNHFIEIQKGSDGFIWIMLHSGSRNFGFKIAKQYHQKALARCQKQKIILPDKDLSFLPIDTKEAKEYLMAMNYALEFAKENRFRMLENIKTAFNEHIKEMNFFESINIHHNYAAIEEHFGQKVIVHRKGATSAKSGQDGLIPGSQGTKSYIVKGLGNKESFMSCSHGAGRRLGRMQAIRELDLTQEIKKLEKQGVIHGIRNKADLDEAAGAYKDIQKVMSNQSDLVEIKIELSPLAVIKG